MNVTRSATPRRDDPANSVAERRIRWAVAASLLVNVGGLGTFALPGQDAVPAGAKVATVVFALVALVGALGLGRRRRWGWWTTLAVTVLNVVSALGGLFDPPSASIATAIIVSIPFGIAVVALLGRKDVRVHLQ